MPELARFFGIIVIGAVAVSAQTKVASVVIAPDAASASNLSSTTINKTGFHGLTSMQKSSRHAARQIK